MKKIISAALVGLLFSSGACFAGFDEGQKAYNKGDFKSALRNWMPLAKQGDTEAEKKLAWMYLQGEGVPKSIQESLTWGRKAAENGDIVAQNFVGAVLKKLGMDGNRNAFKEAAIWFRKSADQGNVDGQYSLGVLFEKGYGVSKDNNEAIKWYSKAAKQGDRDAQESLERLKDVVALPKQTEAERYEEIRANGCAMSNYNCKKDIYGGKY